jgi:hypothetical protein
MLVRVIAKMAHDRVLSMSKLPADFPLTEWSGHILKFNLDYAALMALTALRAVEDEAMTKEYIHELSETEKVATELFVNVTKLFDEYKKENTGNKSAI